MAANKTTKTPAKTTKTPTKTTKTTKTSIPPRPKQAPEGAEWSENDKVFRAGPKDAKGRKQGLWREWYPSGRVSGEVNYVDDAEHGAAWWERGAEGESSLDATFDAKVVRCEQTYDRGVMIGERCFTKSGELVGSDGKAWPKRPATVPDTASWIYATEAWVEGPLFGKMNGRQRLWYRDGQLLEDAHYLDGDRHGKSLRYKHGALTVASDLDGPPLTSLVEADYDKGQLLRAAFFERDPGKSDDIELVPVAKPLAVAHFEKGKLHGKLSWNVDRHLTFMEPVLKFDDVEVTVDELFGEGRVRDLDHVEAEYKNGKIVLIRNFDEHGEEILPAKPVKDFGQKFARAKIPGYIERGDLARDLAAFFPEYDASEIDEDAARAKKVFALLPAEHQTAAKALDALVRGKKFPSLVNMNLEAYGFDTVTNELYGATDGRYFGLAYDGMGNMQFLDLKTGKVLGYETDEGIFDKRRAFASLDEWAFAMVRVELVDDERVPAAAMKKLFKQLGLAAGVFELKNIEG